MSSTDHYSRKIYRKVISVENVVREIEKYVKLRPKGFEIIPLEYALNRVLAEDIYAYYDYPPFDRSLYDGYAVLSDNISETYEDNPVKLKVRGRILAGDSPTFELKSGECCEVATGAPIPYPADSIVPIEFTRERNGEVYIYKRFNKGFGIQFAATDSIKDGLVARKGTIITPLLVGVFATVGINKVKVYTRPKVVIVSIGNELVEVGRNLVPWKVYDSNSLMVKSFLSKYGIYADYLGIIKDDYRSLKDVIDNTLSQYDIIITIGGTSAGLEDITYRVLSKYAPGIVVHGLKIKPGSPTVIAIANNKIILGLPGFSFSCYLILNLVVDKIIRRLLGLGKLSEVERVKAILLRDAEGVLGYVRLLPVFVKKIHGKYYVYPFHLHSGFLSKISLCDGFIMVPENVELMKSGSEISTYLTNYRPSQIIFIGSHCPLFEYFMNKLGEYDINVKYIFTGSMGGIIAVKSNFADIAGSHIYVPETNEYNIDILKKIGVKNAFLIRGYVREQGFIMRKDLIDRVTCFKDIIHLNLRFINRNKGSGTRALIDYLIKREAKEVGESFNHFIDRIRGYNVEVSSHETIALAIRQNKSDIGIGVKYVAEKYGLKFYKLKDEYYDFILTYSFSKSEIFNKFMKYFMELIPRLAKYYGYKLPENFGEAIYKP